MAKIEGKFKMESSENFDEFMKALGMCRFLIVYFSLLFNRPGIREGIDSPPRDSCLRYTGRYIKLRLVHVANRQKITVFRALANADCKFWLGVANNREMVF